MAVSRRFLACDLRDSGAGIFALAELADAPTDELGEDVTDGFRRRGRLIGTNPLKNYPLRAAPVPCLGTASATAAASKCRTRGSSSRATCFHTSRRGVRRC